MYVYIVKVQRSESEKYLNKQQGSTIVLGINTDHTRQRDSVLISKARQSIWGWADITAVKCQIHPVYHWDTAEFILVRYMMIDKLHAHENKHRDLFPRLKSQQRLHVQGWEEKPPHTALGRAASNKCTTAMHIYCDLRITARRVTFWLHCPHTCVLLDTGQDVVLGTWLGFNLESYIL